MLGGWLGPIVIFVAVIVGGLCLRVVDRFERGRRAHRPASPPRPSSAHLIAEGFAAGAPARWNDRTEERIKH